jgi:hypothetical protein
MTEAPPASVGLDYERLGFTLASTPRMKRIL